MGLIAAVTVLYKPDSDALDVMDTYATQVSKCFLIDNSPDPLSESTRKRLAADRFEYQHMQGNKGPAAAANEGVRLAVREGYRFVLTMDQDSRCNPGMVDLLYEAFSRKDRDGRPVAITCPVCCEGPSTARRLDRSWTEVGFCITSGSLIDTKVWELVSGFDERLFIDYVDHDYCLRVRAAGYSILKRHDAVLYHHTGTLRRIGIPGLTRFVSVHSPDRLFYMTRNGFLLKSRYGRQFPEIRTLVNNRTAAQVLKSVLFGPERRQRLSFMIRGYMAYKARGPVRDLA